MKRGLFFSVIISLTVFSCTDSTVYSPAMKVAVEKQLNVQKDLSGPHQSNLFNVFGENLSKPEREALTWLYAWMPLSDVADYNGGFYLRQVRATLQARQEMPWARQIPQDIFLHFVLPLRVNNENLDSSRVVFYRMLRDRVKNLSLREAALEVNHWSHEHVTYRGADMRTSAPLATLCSAIGRCGEESVFTVAALRSVGIPARQVYVPRWAHSDDNHAWVEVWIDGQWYFLGACEPDPDLNMGWFKEPARRAMLVHTRVLGPYAGPEECLASSPRHREINVLNHYAITKPLWIKTITADGKVIAGANISFRLYNYAEFYPLARRNSDEQGLCKLETGLGDLLVWAHQENLVGFAQARVSAQDTVVLLLKPFDTSERIIDLDFHPPLQKPPLPDSVSEAAKQHNTMRLHREDSLRAVYESTFADSQSTARLANSLGLAADTLWTFLRKSRGNHQQLKRFLIVAAPENKAWIFPLLAVISEKDLRDAPAEMLIQHLQNLPPYQGEKSLYINYVLNPRIRNERLSAYHNPLRAAISPVFADSIRRWPQLLSEWIEKHIRLADSANVYKVPLTPPGVLATGSADALSRDIYAVALFRSLGIPARLEPGLERPQYWDGTAKKWARLNWSTDQDDEQTGTLYLAENDPIISTPEYYIHYTLAKFVAGEYQTLELESMPFQQAQKGLQMPAGHYVLITGTRQPSGAVLSRLHFYDLHPGEKKRIEMRWRRDAAPLQPLALMPDHAVVASQTGESIDLAPLWSGKGMILAWLDPGREPSQHVLREWQDLRSLYEQWVVAMVALAAANQANRLAAYQLPGQLRVGEDLALTLKTQVEEALKSQQLDSMPVLLYINPQGRIVWLNKGYRVGLGDQLLQLLRN